MIVITQPSFAYLFLFESRMLLLLECQSKLKQSYNSVLLTKQMKSQQNIPQECSFCSSMPIQKRHLFFILLKSFTKELQRLTQKIQLDTLQNDCNSFKQLIRIIFGEQAIQNETFCDHKKFLTYFTIKLKCSEPLVSFLAQKIVQRLAEKNYQLQLLSIQIKNSAQSVGDGRIIIFDQEQSSRDVPIKTQRPKYKKNKKNTQLQEMRIKVETQINEGIIPTPTTMAGNSIGYFPILSSQYNIAEPTQTSIPMGNVNNIGYYYPYQIYYSQSSQ